MTEAWSGKPPANRCPVNLEKSQTVEGSAVQVEPGADRQSLP